jgi:peroxiredoxin
MIGRKQALTAPDFSARDSEGHEVRLSDFKDKKYVMLVFNRGFQ